MMKGSTRYDDVLDKHLGKVLTAGGDPETEMKAVADEWEKITDEMGRETQIRVWKALKQSYGDKLAPLMSPDL
jgi:hypothetical protein